MAAAPKKKCPPGLPAWLATFGDLMSLLLCFFVLLLSFATIDATKFRKMEGSMKNAFGVQREVVLFDVPMGTTVITQSFSPNVTRPTPVETIRQDTTTRPDEKLGKPAGEETEKGAKKNEETKKMSKKLEKALQLEVMLKKVEIKKKDDTVVISLNDRTAFNSGSAELLRGAIPIIKKAAKIMGPMKGRVSVIGHTDNLPINNDEFDSNWALSSRRAVAVVHEMIKHAKLAKRIQAEGHASIDSKKPNTNMVNRAINRRVEIVFKPDSLPDGWVPPKI